MNELYKELHSGSLPSKSDESQVLDVISKESPHTPVQSSTDITLVRKKASELRDLHLLKTDLLEQLKRIDSTIAKIERSELPDLFSNAGISSITVAADGNRASFVAERSTVYSAKIPDDKRQEAFQWMESHGFGDLIKSNINITFGMQEHERRLETLKLLNSAKIDYYTNESIHHQTLKAFVKHELQVGHIIPFDLLGVYIFDEIKIK